MIKCNYCDKKATHETYTSGIYICEDDGCRLEYMENEGCARELTEEDHEMSIDDEEIDDNDRDWDF